MVLVLVVVKLGFGRTHRKISLDIVCDFHNFIGVWLQNRLLLVLTIVLRSNFVDFGGYRRSSGFGDV